MKPSKCCHIISKIYIPRINGVIITKIPPPPHTMNQILEYPLHLCFLSSMHHTLKWKKYQFTQKISLNNINFLIYFVQFIFLHIFCETPSCCRCKDYFNDHVSLILTRIIGYIFYIYEQDWAGATKQLNQHFSMVQQK